MSYVALYRKFRPLTFDEVKGQDHVVRTLKNQVKTGRLQHAYLFCGTRGTGKTSVAKILARAVNCEDPHDGSPCNECETCGGILSGNSMNVIEIDAASNNGVDNIREIVEEVQYRPTHGKYKVYIIDEVHMLSQGAFNALLKTLEEPPSYVIFILATTEAGKIPVTILSRCQRYDFHRIDVDTLIRRMLELTEREGVQAEEKAIRFIARQADGSMRDALSLLDQCIAFYMGEALTYEKVLNALGEADTDVFGNLLVEVSRGNAGTSVKIFEKLISGGLEISQFVTDFIWYLRNLLMVAAAPQEAEDTVDVTREQLLVMKDLASDIDPEIVMRYIKILSELQSEMRYASNRRVLAEIALIRMTRPQMNTDKDALLGRIRSLEMKLEELEENGIRVAPGSGSGTRYDEVEEEPEEVDDALPCAAPETLKQIKADWPSIAAQLRNGTARAFLKDAKPAYDADTLENKLFVEFGNKLADSFLDDDELREDVMKDLKGILAKRYGAQVETEFVKSRAKPSNIQEITIDKILGDKNRINMDIEIEDGFDEDEEEF